MSRKKKNIIQEIPDQIQNTIKVTWADIKGLFSDKDNLWNAETRFASKAWKRLVHFVQVARTTLDTFAENRMGFQCTALSYCMTLAIVPFIAFVFFVANGFRISDEVSELLHKAIPNNVELVNLVIDKADNIIAAAQSGPVGVISALLFLWTVIWMMFQVERVFNNVWGERKIERKLYKRFGFYFLAMVLLPFILIIFCYGIVMYSNITSLIGWDLGGFADAVSSFVGWLIFAAITTFTLSAMYKFIPAKYVDYRYALKAAMFAAIVFTLFQYLYLETQMFVTRLNGVYGMIAAIPLFLIWLNISWQIIIYGAQLCYSLQYVDNLKAHDWEQDQEH